jgi:hypothetical protein
MPDKELALIIVCVVLVLINWRLLKIANKLRIEVIINKSIIDAKEQMFSQLSAQGHYDLLTDESTIEEFHDQFMPVRKFFIYKYDFCYCNHFNFNDGTVVIFPCSPFKNEFKITLKQQIK